MSFHSSDGYDSLRTLDDEVVVTFVSRYLIVKSVLTCVSIQICDTQKFYFWFYQNLLFDLRRVFKFSSKELSLSIFFMTNVLFGFILD